MAIARAMVAPSLCRQVVLLVVLGSLVDRHAVPTGRVAVWLYLLERVMKPVSNSQKSSLTGLVGSGRETGDAPARGGHVV